MVPGLALGPRITAATPALVTNNGKSARFVGLLIVMVYLTFALALYLVPPRAA